MTGQDHNRPRSLTFYKLWALSDLLPVEFSSPFLPMNLCHFHVDKLGFSGQVFPSPLLPFSPGLLILYHKILGGGWQRVVLDGGLEAGAGAGGVGRGQLFTPSANKYLLSVWFMPGNGDKTVPRS